MFDPARPIDQNIGIVVNGRFRAQRITGVQRYAHEICARLTTDVQVLTPFSGRGAVGHLWEQTALPMACHGRLLWCPNASGPLSYTNQIVTFHDLFPVEHPEWYSEAYSRWYTMMMRRLAQSALHLIAVSEFTKSRLVALFGRSPDEITVIPNGSHLSQPATPELIERAASALKLPTRRYVLSLSSIENRKNLRGLLNSWKAIQRDVPEDIWLVLAGPKVSDQVYSRQDLPTDLPRVLYTGSVPEEHLAGLYTGASLFVFPSFAEGFGLPLLEALACGRRAIAAGTTSIPEVGGDAVTYIDPSDPDDLTRTLRHFLVERPLASDIFVPALERAQAFSWDSAAARTQTVLSAALSRSSSTFIPTVMEGKIL